VTRVLLPAHTACYRAQILAVAGVEQMSDLIIRVTTSAIFLALFVIGGVIATYEFKPTSIDWIVIISFLIFLVLERLANIVDIILYEKSLKTSTDKYVLMEAAVSSSLALMENAVSSSHLVVYTDYNQAYETIIYIAKNKDIISLKNTVFRYGKHAADDINTIKHDEWMDAKASIIRKEREVQEIFDFADPTYKLLTCTPNNKASRFSGKYISRSEHDFIQMTIFFYTRTGLKRYSSEEILA
jgi:hypothetical protein